MADNPVVAPSKATGATPQRPRIVRERRNAPSRRRMAATSVSSPARRVMSRSLPPGANVPAFMLADDGIGAPAAWAAPGGSSAAHAMLMRRDTDGFHTQVQPAAG